MSISANSLASGVYTASTKTYKSESKKASEYGNTIGDVKLSDTGAKYYEELKSKFSGMDFVLVSDEESANADEKAEQFAKEGKTLVVIDASTVEKMASNEEYKNQYEGIIENAEKDLDSMAQQLESSGASVKSYGIKVNSDGTTSFFAVLNKSTAAQKERIAKMQEEKRAAKKEEAKKSEKKEQQEKIKTSDKVNNIDDTETISASSVEELMKKISDFTMAQRSDNVQTEAELMVGQHIDFRG